MSRRAAAGGMVAVLATLGLAAEAPAAPQPPSGPHPRIALTPPVLAALKARAADKRSAVADAIAACRAVDPAPGMASGYQGDAWAFPASACGLAWQLTGEKDLASRGVKLWRALLEDVQTLGDRKACVPGAPRAQALAAVQRDTGYAIRFIGPHAALAYDWLHDAPGVDEALRKQSRECFATWIDWYTTEGYLRRQAGANYHAGYVLAKTLVAVATGGEGGDASDRHWREVVDEVFGVQIVANGLATANDGVPRGPRNGALVGGDWPEGWQYGPLSVFEYAFAARVLDENNVPLPELGVWADALTVRFLHGLLPSQGGMYVGGDTEADTPWVVANGGPLMATMVGPSSPRAAGWAAYLRSKLGVARWGPPAFSALAEARDVAPRDPLEGEGGKGRPLWYLARGTRNVYARSAWDPAAFWAVFTSAPRLVDDHQHPDASNFVFARGADSLIVDPSPYACRSSLTGNAVTVDSDVVEEDYQPSQTFWSAADLPWARATRGGVVAARADFGKAFAFNGKDSDVPLARRDWVFLPEGELVVLDRVVTGGPGRRVYLRFRTPATLALEGAAPAWLARGTVGGSALAIHALAPSPAAVPTVAALPRTGECPDGPFGACTIARFPVNEYALTLTGAEVRALHVLDGLAKGEKPAAVEPIGRAIAGGGAATFQGARVARGDRVTFVVASAGARVAASDPLAYDAEGSQLARHVVFDAPEDPDGKASVTASATPDGRCHLALAASGATMLTGRPLVFAVAPASKGCAVTEDPDQPSDGVPMDRAVQPAVDPRLVTARGCACDVASPPALPVLVLVAVLVLVLVLVRRRPQS
jgi:MYXO-CTERM domain-containing protein